MYHGIIFGLVFIHQNWCKIFLFRKEVFQSSIKRDHCMKQTEDPHESLEKPKFGRTESMLAYKNCLSK